MQWELHSAPIWIKALITYLLIGWCTQLPGAIFYRRYLPRWLVGDGYERHGLRIFLERPIGWIAFTVFLWPVPFVRGGLNLIGVVLALIGLVCSLVLTIYAKGFWEAVGAVVIATVLSLFLARPRRR